MSDLLKEYEEHIISAIVNSDFKTLSQKLATYGVIGSEVSCDFATLDFERLNPSLIARYLFQKIYVHIKTNEQLFEKLVCVLDSFDETANVSFLLKDDYVQLCCSESSDHSEIPSSVHKGRKRPRMYSSYISLKKSHVRILVEILTNCSHKYELIGTALGLPYELMENCEDHLMNLGLRKVLHCWITEKFPNKKSVCLQSLKEALESDTVGENTLAQSLLDTFKAEISSKIKRPCQEFSAEHEIWLNESIVSDGKSTILGMQTTCTESMTCQWLRNKQQLENSFIYSGVHSNLLFIRQACQGTEGKYSLIMEHGETTTTTTTTKEVNLSVEYTPEKEVLLKKYSDIIEVPRDSWPPFKCSEFIKLALVLEKNNNKERDYSVRGDMDDILKAKRETEYTKLFDIYEEGSLVLVEGRPGSGKTTLTHKLIKDWATTPCILRHAKLVILVPLRILSHEQQNLTLLEILSRCFSNDDPTKIANILERGKGEGACFIIDGLDEYPERDNPQNIVYKITNKELLPNAMVIVASRPHGTSKLRYSDSLKKRIEVLGFSKDQIFDYIKKYFTNEASQLIHYLESHVNIFHMCYLPIHTSMICYMHECLEGDFPNTETQIYEHFTRMIIKRNCNCENVQPLRSLDENIKTLLINVSKIAFKMTVSGKQSMHQVETESCLHFNDPNKQSLGLVTVDAAATLFGYEDLYSFLHLTFQEFLAAFHISECDEQQQLEIINSNVHSKEMLMVWKFYCGLAEFTDYHDERLQKLMSSDLLSDLYKSQCVFESQKDVLCESIFMECMTRAMTFKDHIFLPTEFVSIAYTICSVSPPVTEIVFENCSLDESGVTVLVDKAREKLVSLKSLTWSLEKDLEQFKILNTLLKHLPSLEVLDLRKVKLGREEVTFLTESVTLYQLNTLKISMPLEKLTYRSNPTEVLKKLTFNSSALQEVQYVYCESDIETHKKSLIHLLHSFKCQIVPLCAIEEDFLSNVSFNLSMVPKFLQLSTILLVNCGLRDCDLKHLFVGIGLKTLRLDFNKITCKGAVKISRVFKKCRELSCLSLSCNRLGDDGAIELASALTHLPNLIELDLEGNKIGKDGAIALAEAAMSFSAEFKLILWSMYITRDVCQRILEIRPASRVSEVARPIESWKYVTVNDPGVISQAMSCCTYLKTLNLSGRRLSADGAEALAKGLKYCSNLQNIDLSDCKIGFNGMKTLAREVKHCKALKSFSLCSNKIDCDHVWILAEGLKQCCNLRELNLSGNDIGNDGLESLAYELKDCLLEKLQLSQNKIGRNGAAALARWLRSGLGVWKFEADDEEVILNYISLKFFLSTHLNNHVRRTGVCDSLNMTGNKWHTSLLELDLANNNIRNEGAAALGYGLMNCSKIQSLNLVETGIRENGAAVLAHGLQRCASLQTVRLDGNMISSHGTSSISTALSNCQNLCMLSIASSNINSDTVTVLVNGLKTCSNLEILILDNNNISGSGAKALGQTLKYWQHLEKLSLNKCGLNSDEDAKIFKGLIYKDSCSLRELNLNGNKLKGVCITALAASLKYMYQLQHLNLNDIGTPEITDFAALASGLKNCTLMQRLRLGSNMLGLSGTELLTEGLKTFKYLEFLNLSSNSIEASGAEYLTESLKSCSVLQTLILNHNSIKSGGATALFDSGLSGCNQLENISLTNTSIGSGGAEAVANWIAPRCLTNFEVDKKICKRVRILFLGHNGLGLEGITALAKALNYCTELEILQLSNNEIGPDGAQQIAIGLKSCVSLKYLGLDDNAIGSAGVISLGEGIKHCKSIEILHLKNNEIDSHGALALAANLKHCASFRELDLDENQEIEYSSNLANKLPRCDIYTIHGLTNRAVRREEERWQELMDSLPESDSD